MMIFLQSPTIKLSCKNLLRICRTVIQAPFLANLEAAALNWKRLGCTQGAWTHITCCWGLLFKGDSKTVDQRTQKPNRSEHVPHNEELQWNWSIRGLQLPWPLNILKTWKPTPQETIPNQTKQHPTRPRSHEPVLFPPWHDGHGKIARKIHAILNDSERLQWRIKALRVDMCRPRPRARRHFDYRYYRWSIVYPWRKDEKRRFSEVLSFGTLAHLVTSCHVLSHLVTSFPGPSAAHPQGYGDAQEHCFASRLSDGRL